MADVGKQTDSPTAAQDHDAMHDAIQDGEQVVIPGGGLPVERSTASLYESVCGACGWRLDHIPIEQEWELLERCPRCGAYQPESRLQS